MGRVLIGKGVRYLLHDRAFEIVGEFPNQIFQVLDLEFGTEHRVTIDEIYENLWAGKLRFSERGKNTVENRNGIREYEIQDITQLPEERREEARFRLHAIKPLISIMNESLSPHVNKRVAELKAEGHSVSRASLFRWIKVWNESNGDVRSLLSNYSKCGPQDNKLRKEVDIVIQQLIDKMYMRRESVTAKTVHELVCHTILQQNKQRSQDDQLDLPSESTILRRIRDRDVYETVSKRHGEHHAFSKLGQVMEYKKAEYPLHRVECDHTRLDLFVVDDEDRLPIGRPVITTLLDVCTAFPLGMYIGFEVPSYTSVMHALKHAIAPKKYVKTLYPDVVNEWDAYGLPETLVVDNGKEFHSKDLLDASNQLGIELVHCPVRKSWYRGSIERHFRTINQQMLHQLQGTTFSNLVYRKDYNPKKNAVISFKSLLELFHIWLLDYYAARYSKGVRGVPRELWKALSKSIVPVVPAFNPDWEIILGKLEMGSIQRTGIRFKYLDYQAPELWKIRNELLKRGMSKVRFKFDPTNIGKIFVYDEFRTQRYIEVPCTKQEYANGLNFYTHQAIIEFARREAKEVDQTALYAAKAKMMKLVEEQWKTTKGQARRIVARMKGIGSDQEFRSKPIEEEIPQLDNVQNIEETIFELEEESEWGAVYVK